MTDATHRIEIKTDPHTATWPFRAYVIRLSDDDLRTIIPASTQAEAMDAARRWIANDLAVLTTATLWVGDDGQDAEIPL